MPFTWVDSAIVLTYLGAIFYAGIYFSRHIKSTTDFFLASRSMPWYWIMASVWVTNIGLVHGYFAHGGASYNWGLVHANVEWIQGPWQLIIAGFLFIAFYWKAGVFTVPEYLERRYNPGVRLLYAIIFSIFFLVTISSGLYLTAMFMEDALGWNFWICLILLSVTLGVCTCFGGLTAVIMTDVIQFVIMIFSTLPIFFILSGMFGGFSGAAAQMVESWNISPQYFNLMPGRDHPYMAGPWIIMGQCWVAALAWAAGQQAMIQRNLGARTVWDAKFGNVLAGIPKTIGAYIFILPLTLAPLYFAMKGIFVPRPDEAYGLLILNLLPSGMLGLAIAGLFAAGLSTMDSMLNSTSTLFVRDVYERFLVRNKSDAHYFKVARWVTLFGLVICIGLTPFIMKIPLIMQMEKTLMALFEGPLVAILALGIFWRRVNGVGALSALVGGCAANLIMNSFTSMQFLAIEAAGAGIGVVLLVAISLLTGKPDSEQIEGLTWGPGIEYKFEQDLKRLNGLDGKKANTSGWKKRVGRIPFYRDMRVWATIMLLVQIILLLYYSSG